MADNANLSAAEIAARSGIMEGANEELPADIDGAEKAAAPKAEAKPEADAKASNGSEEEIVDDEEDAEGDESDEGTEEAASNKSNEAKPPAKQRSPLRAAFTQIGELRKGQEALASALTELGSVMKDLKGAITPAERKEAVAEVKESVSDLIAKAKESGADAEWLSKFAETLTGNVKAEFEKQVKPLVDELNTLKATEKERQEKEAQTAALRAESAKYQSEWNTILPDLTRQYPNATPELLAEARDLMKTLATSKEYGGAPIGSGQPSNPMPLDYILYKERAKFDTILKVKSGKGGESSGREVQNDEADMNPDDMDLDPENMTPEKFARFEKAKVRDFKPEGIDIVKPR